MFTFLKIKHYHHLRIHVRIREPVSFFSAATYWKIPLKHLIVLTVRISKWSLKFHFTLLITYTSDMAASEAYSFARTAKFSTMQAENFWRMRNDGTYTDFTILTEDKTFQVNTVCSAY